MLKLNETKWSELEDAYGAAADVPVLLEQLSRDVTPKRDVTAEPWFTLWSKLCHQGSVFTASYAAVPYIVQILSDHRRDEAVNMNFFLLPASIETARRKPGAPDVPRKVKADYQASLRALANYAEHFDAM